MKETRPRTRHYRWVVASVFALSIASCGDDGDRGGATSPLTQGANDVSCERGVTLCRDGDVAVCVDLATNAAHCGDCNRPCGDGLSCIDGECLGRGQRPKDESAEPTTSCTPGRTLCSGVCVDTERDALNCGACDSMCGANSRCRGGTCALEGA